MATSILSAIPAHPCVKCGAADRNPQGRCNICNRVRASAWYALNAERAKANGMSYRAANPEKHKAAVARVVAVNPDKKRASDAAWRASNPARISAACMAWRENNPERKKANDAAWKAANPESRRVHAQNRRARKLENGGTLSKGLAAKLFGLQNGKCPCCKQPLGDDYHLDHITPLFLGGANSDENIQLLRAKCNLQKNKKEPIQFMQERGYLL